MLKINPSGDFPQHLRGFSSTSQPLDLIGLPGNYNNECQNVA